MTSGLDIYLMGVCGTGVGALAGMLQRLGHRVRGSDENVYPPMSDKLREWGIEALSGYDPAHLQPPPDLVIIGNVIRAQNPEAVAARQQGLRVLSMPQAVAELGIGERHSIVVAGTHGKTTITALIAHCLVAAGKDPSFLVGGALVQYPESFRVGAGTEFVIEGDEYDTAYFDKGPKFWHYRPATAILTSLEYDHADIYASVEQIEAAFAGFIDRVPDDPSGHLIVWRGAERALALVRARAGRRRVTVYDVEGRTGEPAPDLVARGVESGPAGTRFEAVLNGRSLGRMEVAAWGEVAALNALAAVAALEGRGVGPAQIAAGLSSFAGVRRRMEVRGEPGRITVVDDFGHHPTAVRETLRAARARWPRRRVWAVFEPRSATNRRNIHHHEYVEAFGEADRVVIGSHARMAEVPEAERFDPARLAADLEGRGVLAAAIPDPDDILQYLIDHARADDVLMIFSNGDFGGLHRELIAALEPAPAVPAHA